MNMIAPMLLLVDHMKLQIKIGLHLGVNEEHFVQSELSILIIIIIEEPPKS